MAKKAQSKQVKPAKKPAKTSKPKKAEQDQAKLVAIISYITIIGWVIALVLNSNNKTSLGSYHIRQSLLIMIAGVVFSWIRVVGWIAGIVVFVFWIIGLIAAINGQEKPVPLIGEYAQQWFKGL